MSKMPYEPFSNFFLFPTYATQEDYEKATGQPCPAWNPYRQPKCWFDPEARKSTSRRIIYERALATNPDSGAPLFDGQGRPQLDALVLDREEAATVNIPPKGPGMTNIPGGDQPEVPVPLKAFTATQELVGYSTGGIVVRNTDVQLPSERAASEQAETLRLVRLIAAKLGV